MAYLTATNVSISQNAFFQLPNDITIFTINVSAGDLGEEYNTFNCSGNNQFMVLSAGESAQLNETCTSADNPYNINLGVRDVGSGYVFDIELIYTIGDDLNHSERGVIRGTVVQ